MNNRTSAFEIQEKVMEVFVRRSIIRELMMRISKNTKSVDKRKYQIFRNNQLSNFFSISSPTK
jgi:hypothetical protein